MILGSHRECGRPYPAYPAFAGPHRGAGRAGPDWRHREGVGPAAGTARAAGPAAVLRPGQAGPQGVTRAIGRELLSLASFTVAVAALETGSPYAQLGSSRAKTFSAITEPVVLFVVFAVALLTGTDLPYHMAAIVRSSAGQVIRPGHLLASAALFMVILHETGRIPVETHTGTNEFGMIEEARSFEHSGPYFALLKWGSELKQFILFTILADVFLVPWGLASTQRLGDVVLAIVALLAKAVAVGCVVAVIDDSFAKLRLFKITEYASAAFLLAVLGVFTLYLGGGS
jgi:formate hydrogenlyase subunit 4